MYKNLLIVILSMGIPVLSVAEGDDGHQCTLGDLTRRVEVIYETGVTVPCEVHYYKETEAPGERQVLWRALNEEGYCEARAAEFISKLSAMGWNCGSSAAADESGIEEPETDMPDDTAALAPAEDIELPDAESH
jgi:hypothetical protein